LEHKLVITSSKRMTAALAIILPAAANKTAKSHHTTVHKASAHKTSHAKKATTSTAG
jgi:hypothetical protein